MHRFESEGVQFHFNSDLSGLIQIVDGHSREGIPFKALKDFVGDNDPLWGEFQSPAKICGLCGNTGRIDTRGRAVSNAGVDAGGIHYCICPSGRGWAKQMKPHPASWEPQLAPTEKWVGVHSQGVMNSSVGPGQNFAFFGDKPVNVIQPGDIVLVSSRVGQVVEKQTVEYRSGTQDVSRVRYLVRLWQRPEMPLGRTPELSGWGPENGRLVFDECEVRLHTSYQEWLHMAEEWGQRTAPPEHGEARSALDLRLTAGCKVVLKNSEMVELFVPTQAPGIQGAIEHKEFPYAARAACHAGLLKFNLCGVCQQGAEYNISHVVDRP